MFFWFCFFFFLFYAWSLHLELTENVSTDSQLSYKLKRNFVKWLTWTGKQRERNTRVKPSKTCYFVGKKGAQTVKEPPSINSDYHSLDEKKRIPSNFPKRMVWISDSHKYNFQFSSIRILAVVRPSWFCRSERDFSGYFGPHFLEFILQRKRYKYEQNRIIRDKPMFVVMLKSFSGNLIDIWPFYEIFNFLPIELLFKLKKKWSSLKDNIA